MIWTQLRKWIDEKAGAWLAAQGVEPLPDYTLEEPPAGIEADAACNLAMLLAKPLKKSPRMIAQALAAELKGGALLSEVTIAGAGFLNFTFTPEALQAEAMEILKRRDAYGRREGGARQRVLVEFVSANPTGPLHVGHGRGAALGDSLAKILSHLGDDVKREYYINDAGNQVQLLGQSLLERVKERQGLPFELPAEGYHGDYLKPIARDFLVRSPDGIADVETATRFALDHLLKAIERDLADFGLQFDSWLSEASLLKSGRVDACIERLRARGAVKEEDGATWFVARTGSDPQSGVGSDPSPEVDKDRVLKRKDGRWTYFATDIAYHAEKCERGFDRLVDIWGADHHGYVARVKGSLAALGYDPGRLHVVLYQLVSLTRGGTPVSMSKRSGEFVTLREVLEEVGRDACRFFFALRGPNTAMEFDLELAKKQTNDNPVFYLQYAHARICSIFRQSTMGAAPQGSDPLGSDPTVLTPLTAPAERDLMRRLSLFPQTLEQCAAEDSPHLLANYLLALCRQFHHFYDHHRVLGEAQAVTRARLALLEGVRTVLALGLQLLGVSAPEKM